MTIISYFIGISCQTSFIIHAGDASKYTDVIQIITRFCNLLCIVFSVFIAGIHIIFIVLAVSATHIVCRISITYKDNIDLLIRLCLFFRISEIFRRY